MQPIKIVSVDSSVVSLPFDMGGPEGLPADAPSEQRTALEHTRRLADKDLDQALALARHLDIDVPAIEATRGAFHRAVRL